MKPTVGSLFAGIGGFDLGFERAGFQTLWQVEIDPWARRVLEKNFPHAERFSDIRDCGRRNLQPVDVLCGGFPCQDISNAGLRAGIEGERSGLWGEFARLIGELRPKFVLVENVAALLGRGMGRVLGDLSALGYDAEWEVVSAADVGAPHLRERVWILAYPCGRRFSEPGNWQVEQPRGAEAISVRQAGPEHEVCHTTGAGLSQWTGEALGRSSAVAEPERPMREVPDAVSLGQPGPRQPLYASDPAPDREGQAGHALDVRLGNQWAVEPDVGRVAHGVPRRVDRLRGLGNAVVPQIPELYARRIRPLLLNQTEAA